MNEENDFANDRQSDRLEKSTSSLPVHRQKPLNLSSFCILPSTHLFADNDGTMFFCCMAVESQLPNVDAFAKPYSLDKPERLTEAWNSAFMRQARVQFLKGEKPPPCKRCYQIEDNGSMSLRQHMNLFYKDIVPAVIRQTHTDGHLDLSLYSVDLRLGNKCNLRCRMCSPNSSKALLSDWTEVYGSNPDHFKGFEGDWIKDENFWNLLLDHSKNIRNFHFAGGEPMLIPEMYIFLRKIIAAGVAKNISLTYNTNATVFPNEIFELWPHFKEIGITFSVDGTDRVNNYIRYPARWNQIAQNLRSFNDASKKLNIHHMSINTTVQAYNIFDITHFLRWSIPTFSNIHFPGLSLLFRPLHLSTQVLPRVLREQASDSIASFQKDFSDAIDRYARSAREAQNLRNELSGIREYLLNSDAHEHFLEFQRVTNQFDRRRKQSILDIIPQLAPYWLGGDTVHAPIPTEVSV